MKCRECPDYAKCVKESNLTIKRKNCPKAKTEEVNTNADRIRAMSDEEIAKIFTSAVADGCPPKMYWDCAKDEYGWDACDACWCKWLKQPAEE